MKWIVGFSLIAVIVGAAATATIPAATITLDQAILKLFPPETQGIAFIDVAALRNAALVKDVLDFYRPTVEGHLPEFMTATGIVPQRDVDRVTVGKIAAGETLAVIEARYDRIKAEQYLKDKGMEGQAYLGHTVFSVDTQRGQTYDVGTVTFLDNLIIAGHGEAVKKALDQMSLPGSQPLRSDLMDAIGTIEAGSQVWAAGDFSVSGLPADFRGPAPALELLKSLQSGTYQMRVDQDVHARAIGNFADADAARNLSDMARGFIAVAKLQVARQPDMLHLLDGIQVRDAGTSVLVNIDEPGDLLKKLKDYRLKGQSAQ
jgi:hypothetical protein